MIEYSLSVCPVPTEQQPLNEYEELKQAGFFKTCTLNLQQYASKLAWIWGISWLIAGPVAAASFAPHKYPLQFILSGSAGASVGVLLVLVRMYLGWSYIKSRLTTATIFYEESGWYDGQTWTKPEEVLSRDLLIATYQIQPILRRLQQSFLSLVLLLMAGTVVWNFL
jgi:Conserved in the green lineage and diatoms 27